MRVDVDTIVLPEPDATAVERDRERALPMTLSRSAAPGLALLYQGGEYARQLGEDPWEFAVEIHELKSAGMTVNDLRWLMIGDLMEHACDVTDQGERNRRFKHRGRQRFSRRSCFCLTQRGMVFAVSVLTGTPRGSAASSRLEPVGRKAIAGPGVCPCWDPVRHELSLQGRIVKRFKQHSPNQEAVLTAFQEEDWAPAVLDPLVPLPNQDPKQRLRDTIKNLNRHQMEARVQFTGDGSGERVLWEAVLRA